MTDIVERLRAEGAMTGHYHVPAIQREAAAEIEWLREENERLRAEVVLLEATGAECAEGLRAALRDIASGRYSNIMLPSDPPQDPAVVRARSALAKEFDND